MKPIVNYGLSDSLIDTVRKTVEEALVGGQKKLDVDKDGKLEKSDFASLRAKKDTVNTKPKLKEEEQMDEEQIDEAPLRAVSALVGYPKLNRKIASKGTPGSEDERNKAAAGLRKDRSGLGRRAYTGDQHYDVRREEEQIDEAPMKSGAQSRREVDSVMDKYGFGSKQKEAPKSNIRKVVGKSYGADYKDPEGADETAADMKKAEPKRKSGPQGTMARRFNTKSYEKIKGKLKAQY